MENSHGCPGGRDAGWGEGVEYKGLSWGWGVDPCGVGTVVYLDYVSH